LIKLFLHCFSFKNVKNILSLENRTYIWTHKFIVFDVFEWTHMQ
jgi:hypothetical protein